MDCVKLPKQNYVSQDFLLYFFSGSWLGPGEINMRFGRQKEAAPSSQADRHCSAPARCCFSVGSPDVWGQQTSLQVLQILLDLPLQFLQILVQVHQRVGHLRHWRWMLSDGEDECGGSSLRCCIPAGPPCLSWFLPLNVPFSFLTKAPVGFRHWSITSHGLFNQLPQLHKVKFLHPVFYMAHMGSDSPINPQLRKSVLLRDNQCYQFLQRIDYCPC